MDPGREGSINPGIINTQAPVLEECQEVWFPLPTFDNLLDHHPCLPEIRFLAPGMSCCFLQVQAVGYCTALEGLRGKLQMSLLGAMIT